MPITHVLSILLLVGGLVIISAVAKRLGVDHRYRRRDSRERSAGDVDPGEVAAMNGLLSRMEDRIATLEKILDAEDPKWRNRG